MSILELLTLMPIMQKERVLSKYEYFCYHDSVFKDEGVKEYELYAPMFTNGDKVDIIYNNKKIRLVVNNNYFYNQFSEKTVICNVQTMWYFNILADDDCIVIVRRIKPCDDKYEE